MPNLVPSWKALTDRGHGNMMVRPDVQTLCPISWVDDGKAISEMICDCYWLSDHGDDLANDPIPFSVRNMAKQQLNRLAEKGIELMSAFEFEFRLYTPGGKPAYRNEFSSGDVLAEVEPYLLKLETALTSQNISMEASHTECGSGMLEVTLEPRFGLEAADVAFRFKRIASEVARQMDPKMEVTFMSKPILGETGNGLHFNHSLWSVPEASSDQQDGSLFNKPRDIKTHTRSNLCYDEQNNGLSELAADWVSGLVKYSRPLTALYCPTVNCYRRLHIDWAPENANWGINKRITSYRAKIGGSGGTYLENRIPGGNANPYLVMAAMIAGGIAGLNEKQQIPQNHPNPDQLPKTLEEALQELKDCTPMVETLGSEFVDIFTSVKSEFEIKQYKEDYNSTKEDWRLYYNMM